MTTKSHNIGSSTPSPSVSPTINSRPKPRKLSSLTSFAALSSFSQAFSSRRGTTTSTQVTNPSSIPAVSRVRRKTLASSTSFPLYGAKQSPTYLPTHSGCGGQGQQQHQHERKEEVQISPFSLDQKDPKQQRQLQQALNGAIEARNGGGKHMRKRWSMMSTSTISTVLEREEGVDEEKEETTPRVSQTRLLGPLEAPALVKSRTTGLLRAGESSGLGRSRIFSSGSITGNFGSKLPIPDFITNVRQIKGRQTFSYWCGRFSALNDRFRSEELDIEILSPQIFEDCSEDNEDNNDNDKITAAEDEKAKQARERMSRSRNMGRDERRIRRVFLHLYSLCSTEEARESLMAFQQAYVKHERDGAVAQAAGASLGTRPGLLGRIMGKKTSGKDAT
ncbi:MAG: hypothetical protein M1837_003640 [Sclerophora amabilis]|nr:MAG: hypothetical protein M1837_003640 [Sclerophora amabilis]